MGALPRDRVLRQRRGAVSERADEPEDHAAMGEQPSPARRPRDLRIDFFRGLSLLALFGYHIPGNVIFWVTPSAIGFSDPAEVFVFLAGYSAGLAQVRRLDQRGWRATARHVWTRGLELYRWHLVLGVAFLLLVLWIVQWAPSAVAPYDDFIHALRTSPTGALAYLGLALQPPMLNILPLFIVLFALLPLALPLARRRPRVLLAVSLGLYGLARFGVLHMPPTLTASHWFFDPFAWQLVFVLGVLAGCRAQQGRAVAPFHPLLVTLAVLYLVFAFAVILVWYVPAFSMPDSLQPLLGEVRKWTESPLRVLHFLALAYLVAQFVPAGAAWLRSAPARAVNRVGQHSIELFAAGVVLSLLGMAVFARFGDGLALQLAVDVVGIAILLTLAYVQAPAAVPASRAG
jgi:hypothetical protein